MLTAEQLEVRKSGVGASESAAVMGLSPYDSPMSIWMRKVGLAEVEPNEAMEAGTFLEDGIARWYSHMTGATLHHCKTTLRHPKHKFVLATPDRFIVEGRKRVGLVEIKDVGHVRDDWGEEGTDHVPVHYLVQVAQQLEVTGLPYAKLVAFFHDRRTRPRVYHIERNRELQDGVVDAVGDFWNNNVVPRVAPEIDGSEGSKEYLKKIYKDHSAEIVNAPFAAEKWAAQYFKAAKDEKAAVESKEEAANFLKAYISANLGIRGAWGTATWKMTAGEGTDWKELAQALMRGLGIGGYDLSRLLSAHQKPGIRRFSIKPPKNKE
jgi:putative phage-type endonuclease